MKPLKATVRNMLGGDGVTRRNQQQSAGGAAKASLFKSSVAMLMISLLFPKNYVHANVLRLQSIITLQVEKSASSYHSYSWY
jgi:hypothetical protein